MSSTAPIPNVAEVLIRSTVNDKEVELCLWFRSHLGPVTVARLNTLANRVATAWNINFRSALASGVLFRQVHCIDRSPSGVPPVTVVVDSMGGFGGQSSSGSIALGILNLTDLVPSFPRSQSFIYAIPEAKVNSGVVDSAYASALLGLWSTNNQSHGPFGWHHVAVSLYSGGLPRPTGVVERVTHYALARLNPAAQRRRLKNR